MDRLNLKTLPAVAGFSWKNLWVLVALGAVIGLVLALTVSVPVS